MFSGYFFDVCLCINLCGPVVIATTVVPLVLAPAKQWREIADKQPSNSGCQVYFTGKKKATKQTNAIFSGSSLCGRCRRLHQSQAWWLILQWKAEIQKAKTIMLRFLDKKLCIYFPPTLSKIKYKIVGCWPSSGAALSQHGALRRRLDQEPARNTLVISL